MMRNQLKGQQWRDKVNPVLVAGLQVLRFISRLFNNLRPDQDLGDQATKLFIESYKDSLQFLPEALPDTLQIEAQIEEMSASFPEDDLFANPEVRHAIAEIATRLASSPPDLLKKGFGKPHWWMRHSSWVDFLKKERMGHSLLNLLSLMHFQVSLPELTQRVAEGDAKLFVKLFRFEGKEFQEPSGAAERILGNLDDRATQIVGRALLLHREPRGYQLRLRRVLFFGWDFGLADLTNNELYTFLSEMEVIPKSYDPETLRKYRNRLHRLIKKAHNMALLKTDKTD